jgi:hypothetical protein
MGIFSVNLHGKEKILKPGGKLPLSAKIPLLSGTDVL